MEKPKEREKIKAFLLRKFLLYTTLCSLTALPFSIVHYSLTPQRLISFFIHSDSNRVFKLHDLQKTSCVGLFNIIFTFCLRVKLAQISSNSQCCHSTICSCSVRILVSDLCQYLLYIFMYSFIFCQLTQQKHWKFTGMILFLRMSHINYHHISNSSRFDPAENTRHSS